MTNKCMDSSLLGIEGCIIEDATACRECDVDAGFYMTFDNSTQKMSCVKEAEVEDGCQPGCISCDTQSQRCAMTFRTPFASAFKPTSNETVTGIKAQCLTYLWKNN